MARLCTQCPLTRTVLYIARFNQTNEGRTEKQISGFAALDHPQIIFYIYATNFNLMWYLNFCWALKKKQNRKQTTTLAQKKKKKNAVWTTQPLLVGDDTRLSATFSKQPKKHQQW